MDGPSGYQNCWLEFAAAGNLTRGYVRFYIKGDMMGEQTPRWFVEIENGQPDESAIRLRPQNGGKLYWNRESPGDTIAPDLDPVGMEAAVSLPNDWQCLEISFDETSDLLGLSVNGENVAALEIDGDPDTGFDRRWLNSHENAFDVDVTAVRLGWEGGPANQVAIDEVVISPEPIGCN